MLDFRILKYLYRKWGNSNKVFSFKFYHHSPFNKVGKERSKLGIASFIFDT
jgi:hypothetical protein